MSLEIRELSTADSRFDEEFSGLLDRGAEFTSETDRTVADIISRVRVEGDDAVLELTRRFDGSDADRVTDLEISADELESAALRIEPGLRAAMIEAADRIRRFHKRQVEQSWIYEEETGSRLGQKLTPIKTVGIYVPGGQAAYLSSVLMTTLPARVAGVSEIIMTVPAQGGLIRDSVLAAAHIAGVDRVFTVGGAQAVAALAFGTSTIPKVDKIVGPGNAWVSSAKRQVFGHVGIDLVAGPSEVVVVCDANTNAEWAAMDMFAQAEHDEDAQSILLSLCQHKINEVRECMRTLLPQMERSEIIAKSLASNGALVHVRNREELVEIIDRAAPEHLGLMLDDAEEIAQTVRNAGAIFIGADSPEVIGDYCAGPNHVLPTSGAARFSSPLGVYDFMKRTSIIHCSRDGSRNLAKIAGILAHEERLTAHARSAEYRFDTNE
ncbi:MAG: histidinol dehydrogenase [Acidiferrobacterales bacterium]|nr:histidinol dehydrogenase [Acidiferrobacterales bacterium]